MTKPWKQLFSNSSCNTSTIFFRVQALWGRTSLPVRFPDRDGKADLAGVSGTVCMGMGARNTLTLAEDPDICRLAIMWCNIPSLDLISLSS